MKLTKQKEAEALFNLGTSYFKRISAN